MSLLRPDHINIWQVRIQRFKDKTSQHIKELITTKTLLLRAIECIFDSMRRDAEKLRTVAVNDQLTILGQKMQQQEQQYLHLANSTYNNRLIEILHQYSLLLAYLEKLEKDAVFTHLEHNKKYKTNVQSVVNLAPLIQAHPQVSRVRQIPQAVPLCEQQIQQTQRVQRLPLQLSSTTTRRKNDVNRAEIGGRIGISDINYKTCTNGNRLCLETFPLNVDIEKVLARLVQTPIATNTNTHRDTNLNTNRNTNRNATPQVTIREARIVPTVASAVSSGQRGNVFSEMIAQVKKINDGSNHNCSAHTNSKLRCKATQLQTTQQQHQYHQPHQDRLRSQQIGQKFQTNIHWTNGSLNNLNNLNTINIATRQLNSRCEVENQLMYFGKNHDHVNIDNINNTNNINNINQINQVAAAGLLSVPLPVSNIGNIIRYCTYPAHTQSQVVEAHNYKARKAPLKFKLRSIEFEPTVNVVNNGINHVNHGQGPDSNSTNMNQVNQLRINVNAPQIDTGNINATRTRMTTTSMAPIVTGINHNQLQHHGKCSNIGNNIGNSIGIIVKTSAKTSPIQTPDIRQAANINFNVIKVPVVKNLQHIHSHHNLHSENQSNNSSYKLIVNENIRSTFSSMSPLSPSSPFSQVPEMIEFVSISSPSKSPSQSSNCGSHSSSSNTDLDMSTYSRLLTSQSPTSSMFRLPLMENINSSLVDNHNCNDSKRKGQTQTQKSNKNKNKHDKTDGCKQNNTNEDSLHSVLESFLQPIQTMAVDRGICRCAENNNVSNDNNSGFGNSDQHFQASCKNGASMTISSPVNVDHDHGHEGQMQSPSKISTISYKQANLYSKIQYDVESNPMDNIQTGGTGKIGEHASTDSTSGAHNGFRHDSVNGFGINSNIAITDGVGGVSDHDDHEMNKISKNHKIGWRCNICNKELTTQSGIIAHIRNTHRQCVDEIKKNVDNKCDTNVVNKKILQRYNITKDFNYQCKQCNKIIFTRSGIISHTNSHLGIKKYVCQYCQRRFGGKTARDRHELRHTGARPFKCHLCDKKFTLKSVLVTHFVTHTKEKNFHCDMCDKRYAQLSSLKRHQKANH